MHVPTGIDDVVLEAILTPLEETDFELDIVLVMNDELLLRALITNEELVDILENVPEPEMKDVWVEVGATAQTS